MKNFNQNNSILQSVYTRIYSYICRTMNDSNALVLCPKSQLSSWQRDAREEADRKGAFASAHLLHDGHDGDHGEAAREAVGDERAVALHVARRVRESLQLVDQAQVRGGQALKCAAQTRHRRVRHAAQDGERRVVVPEVDAVFCEHEYKLTVCTVYMRT